MAMKRAQGLARTAVESVQRRHQVGILAMVLLALAPLVLSDILLLKLSAALFFAVFAISWDFVSGYTGYISFGHALFFGTAGYTSAILNIHMGMDPLVTIPIGILAAIVAGILIGVPTLRLQGPYLSLITLIAPLILLQIFVIFRDITGGRRGLLGVKSLTFDPTPTYYLAFGVFVVAFTVAYVITRAGTGTIFAAIREDEDVVSAIGLNPSKFKIFAFVVSAGIGGLGGAVYTHSAVGSPSPSLLLALSVSANVIIATILGGMGTIVGAAAGGVFYFMLRDFLRNLEVVVPILNIHVAEYHLILLYLFTIAVVFYLPEGFFVWLIERFSSTDAKTETDPLEEGTPLESVIRRFRSDLQEILSGDDEK